jgi:hypothetical protein
MNSTNKKYYGKNDEVQDFKLAIFQKKGENRPKSGVR